MQVTLVFHRQGGREHASARPACNTPGKMRRGERHLGKGVVAVVAARRRVAGVAGVVSHGRRGVLDAIAAQVSRPNWVLACTRETPAAMCHPVSSIKPAV